MFERYTEKARRVIFLARYEASNYGSPYIETEHLLLGLIRETVGSRVLPLAISHFDQQNPQANRRPGSAGSEDFDFGGPSAQQRVQAGPRVRGGRSRAPFA